MEIKKLPVISVIVPVYKVEKYLERCVSSIASQTYRELEIILVDDGSPDRCPAICDAWADRDSRIRVIHKPNGGLSDARNAGMEAATGELMGFIDSDDWIEPRMYELLVCQMQEMQADLAACGVVMDWEDETPSRRMTPEGDRVLTREEALRAIIAEDVLKQPVWYKLYRTEQIRGIRFPVGKYHEDVFWSYRAIAKAGRIAVCGDPCYHYIQRAGSIMGAGYSRKRLDAMEAKCQRQRFLEDHFPEIASSGRSNLYFSCIYHGQQALRFLKKEEADQVFAVLRRIFREFPVSAALLKQEKWSHRVWLVSADKLLKQVCKLRNSFGIGL